jgi:hypothetical protein
MLRHPGVGDLRDWLHVVLGLCAEPIGSIPKPPAVLPTLGGVLAEEPGRTSELLAAGAELAAHGLVVPIARGFNPHVTDPYAEGTRRGVGRALERAGSRGSGAAAVGWASGLPGPELRGIPSEPPALLSKQ